jgi:hypothetical protein
MLLITILNALFVTAPLVVERLLADPACRPAVHLRPGIGGAAGASLSAWADSMRLGGLVGCAGAK